MTKQIELKKQAYGSTLKSRALSVLIYLIDRSNKELTCFPAIATMAKQLHISVSTVKRALRELIDTGYVRKDSRFRENNKGQTSNLYTLVLFEGQSEAEWGENNISGKDTVYESEETVEDVQESVREKEITQECCQVEYVCFEMLRQQRAGKDGTAEKERGQGSAEDGCKEKREKPAESELCFLRQFIDWILPMGRYERRLKSKWQLIERSGAIVLCESSCKWLIYLWTGAGVSLMPP